MASDTFDLDSAEQQATQRMAVELREHLALVDITFSICARIAGHVTDAIPRGTVTAKTVTVQLLARACNDLRATALLAVHGYPLQAMTTASSLYEVACTVVYIGSDDARAQEWDQHDDAYHPFRPAFDLLTKAVRSEGIVGDEQVKHLFQQYRVLCWGKHANPLFQKHFGVRGDNQTEFRQVFNGPETSERAQCASWYTLSAAVWTLAWALYRFTNDYLPADVTNQIAIQVKDIADRLQALDTAVATRWGPVIPFPPRP